MTPHPFLLHHACTGHYVECDPTECDPMPADQAAAIAEGRAAAVHCYPGTIESEWEVMPC